MRLICSWDLNMKLGGELEMGFVVALWCVMPHHHAARRFFGQVLFQKKMYLFVTMVLIAPPRKVNSARWLLIGVTAPIFQ